MKPQPQTAPLNILLTDDDIDDRFFFKTALSEMPFQSNLITINDGEQLMKYLSENLENLPDIIFLDLSMPRKTGVECLSEIKENEKLKDIPIVMLTTSYTRDMVYEQGLIDMLYSLGAKEYIRKSNDFDQLKSIINKTLTDLVEKKYASWGDDQVKIEP